MSLRPRQTDVDTLRRELEDAAVIARSYSCQSCPPVNKVYTDGIESARLDNARKPGNWSMCAICYADLDRPAYDNENRSSDVVVLKKTCQHIFHAECLGEWASKRKTCPMCSIPIDADELEELAPYLVASISEDSKKEDFLRAAEEGDVANVVKYLEQALDVNVQNAGGETGLILAIMKGHADIVNLLLRHENIDVNLADEDGYSPMFYAVDANQVDIVNALLEFDGIDVNSRNTNGATPLMIACGMGFVSIAERLLDDPRIDVNIVDENTGFSALFVATSENQFDVVNLLLQKPNIEVNGQHLKSGMTALMLASDAGFQSIVDRLLQNTRVDVNMMNVEGWSALMQASAEGHLEVVRSLLAAPTINVYIYTDIVEFKFFGVEVFSTQPYDAELIADLRGHHEVALLIRDWKKEDEKRLERELEG